jgi:beta-phosphoglucomutase-like phosphatase (HAD superfamily)
MKTPIASAYFFDMDGTLVDTELLWVDATQQSLLDAGYSLSKQELLPILYGRSQDDVVASLTSLFPDLDLPSLETGIRDNHVRLSREHDPTIHSSVELLRRLSERYPVAIVSGSPREDVARYIDFLSVGNLIAFFLGSEDYAPGKPDPACYLLASKRIGVSPPECLVFEDSNAGVEAAKAAGMRCIALKRPGMPDQDFSKADRVLSDLSELVLQEWTS